MARGLALLVGLKSVSPVAYGGWDGTNGCYGCELDVDNIELILSQIDGYIINILKTKQATASAILQGIESAASTLNSGDIFVFYYSGHGGQQPDLNGDESDHKDETLVAYDREIIDDELANLWPRFANGVRIVMISDSCNSGTNYRFRRTITKETPMDFGDIPGMKATMIHYSGCRDGGTSAGYQPGGVFTMALCDTWKNGNFLGTYQQLYDDIVKILQSNKEEQEPLFNLIGNPSPDFLFSRPFSLSDKKNHNIPSTNDIVNLLEQIPISVINNPHLVGQVGLRIDPFTAAVIGVAVGTLTKGKKNIAENKTDSTNMTCNASISEIRSTLDDVISRLEADNDFYNSVVSASKSDSRIFGIDDAAAAAFLAGVVVGKT